MLNMIDVPVIVGLLVIGMITGLVVAGTRGRQGLGQVTNSAIGAVGAIVGGLVYDLFGFQNLFTMAWPPLTEMMIFGIAGASVAAVILVMVRKSMRQF